MVPILGGTSACDCQGDIFIHGAAPVLSLSSQEGLIFLLAASLRWRQESRFHIFIPTRMRVGWHFGTERFESEGGFFRVAIDDATYR